MVKLRKLGVELTAQPLEVHFTQFQARSVLVDIAREAQYGDLKLKNTITEVE